MRKTENTLRPAEIKLKTFYQAHPERQLEVPHTIDEVEDVLSILIDLPPAGNRNIEDHGRADPAAIGRHVLEAAFIEEEMDCGFVEHIRYLPPFWHENEFFELLYVLEGEGRAYVPDGSLDMTAGDICIFAPHTVHAVRAFDDGDRLINIIVRYSTFEKYFFGLLEGNDILSTFFRRAYYRNEEMQYLLFHADGDEYLKRLAAGALEEYAGHSRFRRQMLNAILSQFFIMLFRNHEQDVVLPADSGVGDNADVVYILHYIQEHYRDITLHQLSDLFSYSERQLQRIIEKATGKSFRELIRDQKMKRASDLLLHSSLTIAEISNETGYPSENNFRRIFEAYYGTTPARYRAAKKAPAEGMS